MLKRSAAGILTTAFYLIVDLRTGALRFANAGHPKPFLLRRDSGQLTVMANKDNKGRPALGFSARSVYPTTELTAAAGDAVFLFTDGLYEVEDTGHTLYTVEQLQASAKNSMPQRGSTLIDTILHEVQNFSLGRGFDDDVCALVMEIAGLNQPPA